MGKAIDSIFSWSVEEMRNEFCIEYDYKLMELRVSQIKDKLRETIEMLNNQLKIHEHWENFPTKTTHNKH